MDNLDQELQRHWQRQAVQPRAGLTIEIVALIGAREAQLARARVAIWGSGLLASAIAMLASGYFLWQALYQSGVTAIVASLFSDFTIVAAHWSDFGSSVLEALPIWPLIMSLSSVLAVLLLAKTVTRYTSRVSHRSSLSLIHNS